MQCNQGAPLTMDRTWVRAVVRALRLADYSDEQVATAQFRSPRCPLERVFLEGQLAVHRLRLERRQQTNTLEIAHSVRAQLQRHAFEPQVSASRLARLMGLSVSSLARRCKGETGYSVMEYLHRIRVDEAVRRVLDTSQSVKEVAAAVGYSNTAALDRHFKRYVGMTPTCFRRKEA